MIEPPFARSAGLPNEATLNVPPSSGFADYWLPISWTERCLKP